jgi:hypothetical protein
MGRKLIPRDIVKKKKFDELEANMKAALDLVDRIRQN